MDESNKTTSFLSDKQYRFVKFLTVTLLPAIGTLYFALSGMWHLPAGQEVLGTLMAIQTFIAVVMGVSTTQYNNSGQKYSGEINVSKTPDKTLYSLDLNHAPELLENKEEVTLKVNTPK